MESTAALLPAMRDETWVWDADESEGRAFAPLGMLIMTTLRCDERSDEGLLQKRDEVHLRVKWLDNYNSQSGSQRYPSKAPQHYSMKRGEEVRDLPLWSRAVESDRVVTVEVNVYEDDGDYRALVGQVNISIRNTEGTLSYLIGAGSQTKRDGCSRYGNPRFRMRGAHSRYSFYLRMERNMEPGCA